MTEMKFRVRMSVADNTAEIRVGSDIGESWFGDSISANDFADQVKQLGNVSKINLVVNSPGGDVFDAAAMTETLKRNAADVTVLVDGLMASAATFFLDAADEVVMGANSTIVIHDAWSGVMGNASDMRAQADILDKLSGQIAELYARRAGGTADAWRNLMLDETWFTAQEAVDAGLADSIAEELETLPAAAALAGRPAAYDPLRIVAKLRDESSRPARAETRPSPTASIKKETVVAEATASKEESKIDGNAIEALLKFQFDAFEAKNSATNEKTFQKFMDALEPAPTVAEVKTAVLADMQKKNGPTLRDLTALIAARVSGKATDSNIVELNALMNSSRESVFNAFTYSSGGQNEMPNQFVGDLLAKGAWNPVVWDLIGHDELTGPTVYGGAASTLPVGGSYAGGGAAVSSTAPVWAQESLAATRYALAAGLDRINFDFGQAQAILNSFFGYAVTDYYKFRDTQAITNMLGTSTGFFGALTALTAAKAPTNSILQDAVSKITKGIISIATQANATASFAALTAADFTSLLQASQQQAPAFWSVDLGGLTNGNAEGKFAIRLDATGTLSTGQTLVGAGGPGMTGYELGDGAIRVEQVVTATGTVDTGLFGYVAPLRTNANYFALVNAVSTT